MHDVNLRVSIGKFLGKIAGSIWGVVIDNQNLGIGNRIPDPFKNHGQRLILVIGRDNDENSA